MGFLVLINIFISFSSAAYESCTCPVITCEPCQVQIFLGKDIKKCEIGRSVECEKSVCENVDNYFQCVAGETPLYVPAQSQNYRILSHLTEPQYGNLKEPISREINFDKIRAQQQVLERAQVSPKSREIASLSTKNNMEEKLQPYNKAFSEFKVKSLKGGWKSSHGSSLKINQKIPWGEYISSSAGSLTVEGQQQVITLRASKKSQLHWSHEDDYLVLNLMGGSMDFNFSGSLAKPVLLDLGKWRVGKREGRFSWSREKDHQEIQNNENNAWLRKNELTSKSVLLNAGEKIIFDENQKMTQVQELTRPASYESYRLQEPKLQTPLNRGLASSDGTSSEATCQAPAGQFEQCAWKCFSGSTHKNCHQKNSKGQQCVRFTCGADGQWKMPTLSSFDLCDPQYVKVGPCQ